MNEHAAPIGRATERRLDPESLDRAVREARRRRDQTAHTAHKLGAALMVAAALWATTNLYRLAITVGAIHASYGVEGRLFPSQTWANTASDALWPAMLCFALIGAKLALGMAGRYAAEIWSRRSA